MNIRTARDITRNFKNEHIEYSPVFSSDWIIKKEDARVYFSNDSQKLYYSTAEKFLDEVFLNPSFSFTGNKLNGEYYFTSFGLISQTEYFEAEDLIEQYNIKIPEKDLVSGNIYISNKGVQYIYLGKIKFKSIINENNILYNDISETQSLCISFDEQKLINTNSIKFVDFVGINTDEFEFDIRFRYFQPNLFKEISAEHQFLYSKLLTNFDNIYFTDSDFENISSQGYYEKYDNELLSKFIDSNEKEIRLSDIPKKVKVDYNSESDVKDILELLLNNDILNSYCNKDKFDMINNILKQY